MKYIFILLLVGIATLHISFLSYVETPNESHLLSIMQLAFVLIFATMVASRIVIIPNQVAKKSTRRVRKGYVYLLRIINTDNLYKIGRTKNPDNRLATFGSKLPFPVEYDHLIKTDDMYALESELHAFFTDKRQIGSEFFMLQSEDVTYIKSL